MKAKPLPKKWTVQHAEDGTPWIQGEPDENGFRTVATMPNHFAASRQIYEDNAKLIVQSVNAHEALLSALQDCVEVMHRAFPDGLPVKWGTYTEEQDWNGCLRQARELLAKFAKGEA